MLKGNHQAPNARIEYIDYYHSIRATLETFMYLKSWFRGLGAITLGAATRNESTIHSAYVIFKHSIRNGLEQTHARRENHGVMGAPSSLWVVVIVAPSSALGTIISQIDVSDVVAWKVATFIPKIIATACSPVTTAHCPVYIIVLLKRYIVKWSSRYTKDKDANSNTAKQETKELAFLNILYVCCK